MVQDDQFVPCASNLKLLAITCFRHVNFFLSICIYLLILSLLWVRFIYFMLTPINLILLRLTVYHHLRFRSASHIPQNPCIAPICFLQVSIQFSIVLVFILMRCLSLLLYYEYHEGKDILYYNQYS